MKIFEFNPTTGRRGDIIDQRRIPEWHDQSVRYQVGAGLIAPIEFAEPVGFGRDAEVTVHVDAGRRETSYRMADQWICFCSGHRSDGLWIWAVIPPTSAIQALPQECAICASSTLEWKFVSWDNGDVEKVCSGCAEHEIGEGCAR